MNKAFIKKGILIATVLGFANLAIAADVTIPHTFVSGETAKASEVNENFNKIIEELNNLKNASSSGTGGVDDIALSSKGAKATASSVGSYAGYTASADKAIDPSSTVTNDNVSQTFWCSTSTPTWYKIEFDKVYNLDKVFIETYYHSLTNIDIEVSEDGTNWFKGSDTVATTVNNIQGHIGGENDIIEKFIRYQNTNPTVAGGQTVGGTTKHPGQIVKAKFVRINIGGSDAPGGHIYKACLSDVRVYPMQ